MSNNGKVGNGRLNNRKRPFKRRENEAWQEEDNSGAESHFNRNHTPSKGNNSFSKKGGDRLSYHERPKWIPPKTNTDPLPVSECPWCGKPIRDMSSAIADKDTGTPVHFDCVTARIAFGERLEKGDSIAYIGGGRFGIVSLGGSAVPHRSANMDYNGRDGTAENQDKSSSPSSRSFTIKKIIEWENKDTRAEWRSVICDHFSVT